MKSNANKTKYFLLGLSLSVIVLVSFFGGALADRVFVVKPLDYVVKRKPITALRKDAQETSPLSGLLNNSLGSMNVADVAEVTSESVVTVSIKKQQRVLDPLSSGVFGLYFGLPTETVEEIQRDIGTGFVVDQEEGLIVTNRHVVSDPQAEYSVIDKNEQEYAVTKIYRDPSNDLAIVKIDNSSLPAIPLGDSDILRVGESVIAIGTALGEFRHTVTTGVISGLGRGIEAFGGVGMGESLENVIQTDAAINPGNSGGPLLNAAGEVIGVNVAVSAVAENIGFALPINIVKASLQNFNETGQFDRAFFGVSYRIISEQAALLNEVPQGAYVLEVVPESTAAAAGIQPGDIITQFGTQKVTENQNLAEIVNSLKIGKKISISFWRDGQQFNKEVTLKGQ